MEGYIIRIIPEVRVKVCSGCEHYSRVLAVSGYNPIYKTDCLHPNAHREKFDPRSPLNGFPHGNLLDDYTPMWCPVGERKINEKPK